MLAVSTKASSSDITRLMDNYGVWGIIPPVLTIVLAFLTKDVVVSLFLGILSGALIVGGGNLVTALFRLTDLVAGNLADGWNIRIFLFCALLGGLVGLLTKTGSASSFGRWATKGLEKLANEEASEKRKGLGAVWAQLMAMIFGIIIFIDDYFNSLSVGTVMRPICDKMKVPRAKLAYILDSTAAPICILAPISSWVVTVMSTLRGSQGFSSLGVSEISFFVRAIPYNLYAIGTLLMVILIILTKRDFGPMKNSVERALKTGSLYNEEEYGAVPGKLTDDESDSKRKSYPIDMLFPILTLIITAVVFFPVTTWLGAVGSEEGITTFSEAVASMSLGEAFNNTDSSKALCYSIVVTIFLTYIYYLLRRLLSLKDASSALTSGIMSMVPALIILAMAWSIGAIIKTPKSEGGLGLGLFLSEAVKNGGFPISVLPAVLFILSAVIAFSTGTSWGTFAIMIPIGLPIVLSLAEVKGMIAPSPEALNTAMISIGAIIGGAVFGDHSSPISDTTILSSTGAACPHLEHVATQMPYAVFVAVCSVLGFLVGGILMSALAAWIVMVICMVAGLIFVPIFFDKIKSKKAGL